MPTSSEYGPEVYELCLQMYTIQQMSYDKIAQHLYDNKIVHKVYHRSTILRWCADAEENAEEAKTLRQRVEDTVAAVDLDKARQLAYDLLGEDDPAVIEAKSKALKGFLDVRDARSRTYGTYAPKRKEVAVTDKSGGVTIEELSKKAEEWQAQYNDFFVQGNGERPTEDVDQP